MPRLILPIQRTSPFAYPGRQPRLDSSHPFNNKIRYLGVASGANFISLLNGKAGTPSISGPIIDGQIGPAATIATTTGGGNNITVAAGAAAASNTATIAVIFKYSATSAGNFQGLFGTFASGFGWWTGVNQGTQQAQLSSGGTNVNLGPALVVGAPYFLVVSGNSVGVNMVVTRLDTGSIQSATGTWTFAAPGGEGPYVIGTTFTFAAANGLDGSIAAIGYNAQFMSIPQMRQLAQDPWAIWYPRTLDLASMLSTASGGGGTTVTTDFGGIFEWLGSLRSDAPALLESLSSVRADRSPLLESTAAVRLDISVPLEVAAAVSASAPSQTEFLGSMRADNLGPLETAAAFRSDVIALMEALSGQRSDAAVAGEIMASLRADLVGPLENLGAVNVISDGAVQIETTAAVRSDSVASMEVLSSVRRDTPAPIEEAASSSTQAGALTETTGAVRSDSTSQIETGGTMRADAAISAETIGSVTSQSVATMENTAGVARDAPVPQESLGGLSVIFSSALQLEFLGVAVNSAVEWILRARRRHNR